MTTTAKKHGPSSILAWIIWAIATTYFFWDYLQQVAPGAMGMTINNLNNYLDKW